MTVAKARKEFVRLAARGYVMAEVCTDCGEATGKPVWVWPAMYDGGTRVAEWSCEYCPSPDDLDD